MRRLKVAIDGPAASGKSTVAKLLARRLGYQLLDTGAMYRAVAWAALQANIPLDDGEALGRLAASLTFQFLPNPEDSERPYRLLINGVDVTEAIRQPAVDQASSVVAQHQQVRHVLVQQQRRLAEAGGVIMEGRDITTVVLPDAEVKVFLTASLVERARRRLAQYQAQRPDDPKRSQNLAAVLGQLARRDYRDSTRDVSPLRVVREAFVLDTTGLSVEETVEVLWRQVQLRLTSDDAAEHRQAAPTASANAHKGPLNT